MRSAERETVFLQAPARPMVAGMTVRQPTLPLPSKRQPSVSQSDTLAPQGDGFCGEGYVFGGKGDAFGLERALFAQDSVRSVNPQSESVPC